MNTGTPPITRRSLVVSGAAYVLGVALPPLGERLMGPHLSPVQTAGLLLATLGSAAVALSAYMSGKYAAFHASQPAVSSADKQGDDDKKDGGTNV